MGILLVGEGCGRSDCRDDSRRDGSYLATLLLGSVVASTASCLPLANHHLLTMLTPLPIHSHVLMHSLESTLHHDKYKN
jgi:hypothetical protein